MMRERRFWVSRLTLLFLALFVLFQLRFLGICLACYGLLEEEISSLHFLLVTLASKKRKEASEGTLRCLNMMRLLCALFYYTYLRVLGFFSFPSPVVKMQSLRRDVRRRELF
ncbi:hypothetical protein B0T19DRAFT_155836 [Cercophora scortea]|uniref:Uncharacterized protein n=1 Tax=Cercophora scortea TaxID=314031 RepID=A0AAE0MCJ0_9PEZI|nr:hypothetical protein B0T19DRAFT_155836 [Cercophora scortea]